MKTSPERTLNLWNENKNQITIKFSKGEVMFQSVAWFRRTVSELYMKCSMLSVLTICWVVFCVVLWLPPSIRSTPARFSTRVLMYSTCMLFCFSAMVSEENGLKSVIPIVHSRLIRISVVDTPFFTLHFLDTHPIDSHLQCICLANLCGWLTRATSCPHPHVASFCGLLKSMCRMGCHCSGQLQVILPCAILLLARRILHHRYWRTKAENNRS